MDPAMAGTQTLVYHAGALGDFITALPVLRVWRREHRGTRITLLGRPGHGILANASGYIDDLWDLDAARHASLFDPGADAGDLRALAHFDTALIFAAEDSPLLGNLARAGVPRILHQPPFPAQREHVVDYHLSMLPPNHVTDADRIPVLPFHPAEQRPRTSRLAVIHPGSGSQEKNWPIERFAALATACAARGLEVTWLLGEAEGNIHIPPGHRAARMPPLTEVARLLSRAAVYVGNDSGITHLAAAVGCPTVAIFGPTDPAVWAPRGPRVIVMAASRPAEVTTDRVLAAVRSLIDHGVSPPGRENL